MLSTLYDGTDVGISYIALYITDMTLYRPALSDSNGWSFEKFSEHDLPHSGILQAQTFHWSNTLEIASGCKLSMAD